ncbi:MAG: hypothetical protein WDN24_06380 [Sphingomonas sp.]
MAIVLPFSQAALAQPIPPLPVYNVGDTIVNPVTGFPETVVQLTGDYAVLTSANNSILLANAVGQTFTGVALDGITPVVYTVTAVTLTGSVVTSVTLEDPALVASTQAIVTDISADIAAATAAPPPGAAGVGTTPFVFPAAAGDVNNIANAQRGNNGSNGSDGFGVRICFFVCFTIGKDAGNGGAGGNGPPINVVIPASHGAITTVSANLPGIVESSVGGNGGKGGNQYLAARAGAGGAAGVGQNVIVVSNVPTITTSGANSYGIFAQSRSGEGGKGGTGYFLSGGGSGGAPAGQGGIVHLTSNGNISTSGTGASGILAQSLGGGAGSGGGSYGIVGNPGEGSVGGRGSDVTVINTGTIVTSGNNAAGIQAQSIGGTGGNSGAGGGIVSFGATGGGGGDGADVRVTHSGSITTTGMSSRGIFAQSIGGAAALPAIPSAWWRWAHRARAAAMAAPWSSSSSRGARSQRRGSGPTASWRSRSAAAAGRDPVRAGWSRWAGRGPAAAPAATSRSPTRG